MLMMIEKLPLKKIDTKIFSIEIEELQNWNILILVIFLNLQGEAVILMLQK